MHTIKKNMQEEKKYAESRGGPWGGEKKKRKRKEKKMRFEPGSSISSTCCTTIHVSHMCEKTRYSIARTNHGSRHLGNSKSCCAIRPDLIDFLLLGLGASKF